jgi:hypothetical protein
VRLLPTQKPRSEYWNWLKRLLGRLMMQVPIGSSAFSQAFCVSRCQDSSMLVVYGNQYLGMREPDGSLKQSKNIKFCLLCLFRVSKRRVTWLCDVVDLRSTMTCKSNTATCKRHQTLMSGLYLAGRLGLCRAACISRQLLFKVQKDSPV